MPPKKADYDKCKIFLKNKFTNPKNRQPKVKQDGQVDFIYVQVLSKDVKGKWQKYEREGALEFVPLESGRSITLEYLKQAIQERFKLKIGGSVDILAGDRGPSVFQIEQLGAIKSGDKINVRFLTNTRTGGFSAPSNTYANSSSNIKRPPTLVPKSTSNIKRSRPDSYANIASHANIATSTNIPKTLKPSELLTFGKELPPHQKQQKTEIVRLF